MLGLIPVDAAATLGRVAAAAGDGRILAFGRRLLDYGRPLDWHLNPDTGERWDSRLHWSRVQRDEPRVGDVKLTLEPARFPHAYHLARAAALGLAEAGRCARVLDEHVAGFLGAQAYGRGVHWLASQEWTLRLMAWLFARHALAGLGQTLPLLDQALPRAAFEAGAHIERYVDYSRRSTFNNHLICEALGLLLAGLLLPGLDSAERWRAIGTEILAEQAERQVYADGAYLMASHNYHRVVVQELLWASRLVKEGGAAATLTRALERSLDFLFAHQNPADGRLPNFGANDGSLVSILSCCDFSDFRPTLQALSLATRGERLYEPGPWDEEAAWLLGPERLDAPRRAGARRSVSFAASGYHVLRGRAEGSFACFRCGPTRQRFAQIDMLHLDVWWRGQNVLVDGGSYLYNGPPRWHDYFLRTASHNTLSVDGRDQMLHLRRFKVVHWTRARALEFSDRGPFAACSGEHYGYGDPPAGPVHRRSVLFVKDDLWVVCDRVGGEGVHEARVHWLCGPFPGAPDPEGAGYRLETPEGPFWIELRDAQGLPLPLDAASGGDDPPRGWSSRCFSEKVAVPSLAATLRARLPLVAVSVLAGGGRPKLSVEASEWSVALGASRVRFRLDEGGFVGVAVEPAG
jgi:asparagine synthase (glutamine-hydrolysing)